MDDIIGPVSTCCNWFACIADAGTWMVSTRGSEFGTFGWGGSVIWIGTIFVGSKPATTAGGAGGVCVWGCAVDCCCVWLSWAGLWVPFVWLGNVWFEAFALFSVAFCCCNVCCCGCCDCLCNYTNFVNLTGTNKSNILVKVPAVVAVAVVEVDFLILSHLTKMKNLVLFPNVKIR